MAEFRMPSLGADMESGTLVAWRSRPGDVLQRGDIIAEVETEKGVIEVEVFAPGVLERCLVEPGTKVPVGTPLAVLREDGETRAEAAAPPRAEPKEPAAPSAAEPPPAVTPEAAARERAAGEPGARGVRMSPAARRRARELGVDASRLQGSGPGGAIALQDIEHAAEAATRPAAPARAMRRAIGAAMARSKREIPHYYLGTAIDLGGAMAWLAARNAERSVRERLLPAALLAKAVAQAARRMPDFNAYFENDEARTCDDVHLGLAIALRGGGLVAPAVHHADRLDIDALMAAMNDLVARARSGTLRSSELRDGTITVTSLGERGVETVFPIIYPPQTAIVGFGRIAERPWVVAGQLAVRPVVQATLAADHRVTDGHLGARFLALIDQLLQEPATL